jgi:hypothetical protein
MSLKVAHCRDGGRPSWRPVVEAVLPPLWHQSHKGYAPDCHGGNYPRTAVEGPRPVGPASGLVPIAAAVAAG